MMLKRNTSDTWAAPKLLADDADPFAEMGSPNTSSAAPPVRQQQAAARSTPVRLHPQLASAVPSSSTPPFAAQPERVSASPARLRPELPHPEQPVDFDSLRSDSSTGSLIRQHANAGHTPAHFAKRIRRNSSEQTAPGSAAPERNQYRQSEHVTVAQTTPTHRTTGAHSTGPGEQAQEEQFREKGLHNTGTTAPTGRPDNGRQRRVIAERGRRAMSAGSTSQSSRSSLRSSPSQDGLTQEQNHMPGDHMPWPLKTDSYFTGNKTKRCKVFLLKPEDGASKDFLQVDSSGGVSVNPATVDASVSVSAENLASKATSAQFDGTAERTVSAVMKRIVDPALLAMTQHRRQSCIVLFGVDDRECGVSGTQTTLAGQRAPNSGVHVMSLFLTTGYVVLDWLAKAQQQQQKEKVDGEVGTLQVSCIQLSGRREAQDLLTARSPTLSYDGSVSETSGASTSSARIPTQWHTVQDGRRLLQLYHRARLMRHRTSSSATSPSSSSSPSPRQQSSEGMATHHAVLSLRLLPSGQQQSDMLHAPDTGCLHFVDITARSIPAANLYPGSVPLPVDNDYPSDVVQTHSLYQLVHALLVKRLSVDYLSTMLTAILQPPMQGKADLSLILPVDHTAEDTVKMIAFARQLRTLHLHSPASAPPVTESQAMTRKKRAQSAAAAPSWQRNQRRHSLQQITSGSLHVAEPAKRPLSAQWRESFGIGDGSSITLEGTGSAATLHEPLQLPAVTTVSQSKVPVPVWSTSLPTSPTQDKTPSFDPTKHTPASGGHERKNSFNSVRNVKSLLVSTPTRQHQQRMFSRTLGANDRMKLFRFLSREQRPSSAEPMPTFSQEEPDAVYNDHAISVDRMPQDTSMHQDAAERSTKSVVIDKQQPITNEARLDGYHLPESTSQHQDVDAGQDLQTDVVSPETSAPSVLEPIPNVDKSTPDAAKKSECLNSDAGEIEIEDGIRSDVPAENATPPQKLCSASGQAHPLAGPTTNLTTAVQTTEGLEDCPQASLEGSEKEESIQVGALPVDDATRPLESSTPSLLRDPLVSFATTESDISTSHAEVQAELPNAATTADGDQPSTVEPDRIALDIKQEEKSPEQVSNDLKTDNQPVVLLEEIDAEAGTVKRRDNDSAVNQENSTNDVDQHSDSVSSVTETKPISERYDGSALTEAKSKSSIGNIRDSGSEPEASATTLERSPSATAVGGNQPPPTAPLFIKTGRSAATQRSRRGSRPSSSSSVASVQSSNAAPLFTATGNVARRSRHSLPGDDELASSDQPPPEQANTTGEVAAAENQIAQEVDSVANDERNSDQAHACDVSLGRSMSKDTELSHVSTADITSNELESDVSVPASVGKSEINISGLDCQSKRGEQLKDTEEGATTNTASQNDPSASQADTASLLSDRSSRENADSESLNQSQHSQHAAQTDQDSEDSRSYHDYNYDDDDWSRVSSRTSLSRTPSVHATQDNVSRRTATTSASSSGTDADSVSHRPDNDPLAEHTDSSATLERKSSAASLDTQQNNDVEKHSIRHDSKAKSTVDLEELDNVAENGAGDLKANGSDINAGSGAQHSADEVSNTRLDDAALKQQQDYRSHLEENAHESPRASGGGEVNSSIDLHQSTEEVVDAQPDSVGVMGVQGMSSSSLQRTDDKQDCDNAGTAEEAPQGVDDCQSISSSRSGVLVNDKVAKTDPVMAGDTRNTEGTASPEERDPEAATADTSVAPSISQDRTSERGVSDVAMFEEAESLVENNISSQLVDAAPTQPSTASPQEDVEGVSESKHEDIVDQGEASEGKSSASPSIDQDNADAIDLSLDCPLMIALAEPSNGILKAGYSSFSGSNLLHWLLANMNISCVSSANGSQALAQRIVENALILCLDDDDDMMTFRSDATYSLLPTHNAWSVTTDSIASSYTVATSAVPEAKATESTPMQEAKDVQETKRRQSSDSGTAKAQRPKSSSSSGSRQQRRMSRRKAAEAASRHSQRRASGSEDVVGSSSSSSASESEVSRSSSRSSIRERASSPGPYGHHGQAAGALPAVHEEGGQYADYQYLAQQQQQQQQLQWQQQQGQEMLNGDQHQQKQLQQYHQQQYVDAYGGDAQAAAAGHMQYQADVQHTQDGMVNGQHMQQAYQYDQQQQQELLLHQQQQQELLLHQQQQQQHQAQQQYADPEQARIGDIEIVQETKFVSNQEVHKAAQAGKIKELKKLVQQYGVDICDEDQRTPLMYAAMGDSRKACQVLLQLGADVDKVDTCGLAAVHWAAYTDKPQALQALLKHGANHSMSLLDTQNRSALHWAIRCQDTQCMRLIVQLTSRDIVNHRDPDGLTALHWCVACEHVEHLTILLQVAADLALVDNDGRTPLTYAVLSNSVQCISTILQHFPEALRAVDENGRTSLHFASADGQLDTVMALLPYPHCDVNAQDGKGFTPLHWALAANRPQVVTALLRRGANCGIPDAEGRTPLDFASMYGHTECIAVMEQFLTDPQQQQRQRQQALRHYQSTPVAMAPPHTAPTDGAAQHRTHRNHGNAQEGHDDGSYEPERDGEYQQHYHQTGSGNVEGERNRSVSRQQPLPPEDPPPPPYPQPPATHNTTLSRTTSLPPKRSSSGRLSKFKSLIKKSS
ncbi:uncharacterized protein LOC135828437 [Sycon ciliatum]|uniref:uncharacterized protein LOC135828437 n=1 Tax=Sycon ciliatum TaxID=27933 RepID=UPI0031F676C0